ncbi:MAG: hypothetical protein PHE24_04925 [Patescibacteria group bacterium]|nr:hypothetical protein [Patescibacteria group bacterium]
MKFSISAVVAMIAMLAVSAMAFTPPNNDEVGITTDGIIFVKALRITQLKPQVNPPGVMCELMKDANHHWITGLKTKRDGNYFIYETGFTVPAGKEVQFCFYLGVNFWMPDCYYEGTYASFGAEYISDWKENAPPNGPDGGGHNFRYSAVQAK